MLKSTHGWREAIAKMSLEDQATVKAMIKRTIPLRRQMAERETEELIRKWQRAARVPG
jgi:hypothetical protein